MITYILSKKQTHKIINLNKINPSFNEVVFQAKEYSSKEIKTSIQDVLDWALLLSSSINKYFAIDIIPFNKDIEKIRDLLKILVKNKFYGVRTEDLSVLNIVEEESLNLKVILDSTTGGNNINYYNFFSKFKSIERVVLSRELSISKILEYGEKSKVKLELQAYGLLQIFHTKRNLIEAMRENTDENLSNLLYLKEPKRPDESFPLLETNDGTFMFHSKLINFYNYQKELLKFNITQLIDLRHIENTENYEKILKHFMNIENYDLSLIEVLPFLQVPPKGGALQAPHPPKGGAFLEGLKKIGTVLDSVKGKELILKSNIELKLEMELIFYNNKKKELSYTIKYISKFGELIYIIPWRKGVTSNSSFYIRDYEKKSIC